MEQVLVEFAQVLRQNGLRISPSELQDAARATAEVGLDQRDSFRTALEVTLVKRSADVQLFRRAFNFYFSGAARTFAGLDASLLLRLQEHGLLEGDDFAKLVASLESLRSGLSPLTSAVLDGTGGEVASLFRGASLQLDFSGLRSVEEEGFFSRRLAATAGLGLMRADAAALQGELEARGCSLEGLEVISTALAQALRQVEQAAQREIARQVRARIRTASATGATQAFSRMAPADLARAQSGVRRLAIKLKSRLLRRRLHPRRGALHMRQTMRRNLAWGGLPMVPVFRSRRAERPEIVVLCDISDSVRNVSLLMLAFMHTLQSLVVRVRSFVFVSDLTEVTASFKGVSLDRALEAAIDGTVISRSGNSNYGRALKTFVDRELCGISRRTTVVVIGDARNNFNSSGASSLREIRRRCRRLLWICPEPEETWGAGDSEMLTFSKIASQAFSVVNLTDLESLADRLLPT